MTSFEEKAALKQPHIPQSVQICFQDASFRNVSTSVRVTLYTKSRETNHSVTGFPSYAPPPYFSYFHPSAYGDIGRWLNLSRFVLLQFRWESDFIYTRKTHDWARWDFGRKFMMTRSILSSFEFAYDCSSDVHLCFHAYLIYARFLVFYERDTHNGAKLTVEFFRTFGRKTMEKKSNWISLRPIVFWSLESGGS